MKLTMMCMGSTGDVRPYILLGRELKRRGHQVTIVAFRNFREMVTGSGLDFFPLSADARDFMGNVMRPSAKGPGYLTQINKTFKDIAPLLLQELMQAGEGADAICCTFFGSVFYSVAEKYRIPCIQTHYFPMDSNDMTPISSTPGLRLGKAWYHATYRLGYLLISLLEKYLLTDWREENEVSTRNVRTTPDYTLEGRTIPVIYAMSESVFPRDPSWGPKIYMSGYWWDEQPEPYTPPADLQAFLDAGEPPVYIGFGSMVSGNMRKTASTVLSAVHRARVRAVFSVGWNEEIADLKSTGQVFFADYVPHDWLFPRVSAVVHHGGAGTTAAGLRYGKPTLVVPFGGDQPFWGKRVFDIGCGPRPIPREAVTSASLARALRKLTGNPAYRRQAELIGREISAEHGVQRAADIIEKEIREWKGTKEAGR